MKCLKKTILVTALLSAGYAHAQVPSLGGDFLNTAPIQLLGLAAPILELAEVGGDTITSIAPQLGDAPLVGTLLELPSSGAGLLGVLVPLGSGVLINGGPEGLLGLAAGLPITGDLLGAQLLPGLGDFGGGLGSDAALPLDVLLGASLIPML
ncbi:hypothetical protein NCG89_13810 [Spongiibacter taiwanensis]|uniref:hypothetical protein n=1 Tax=Spongiibacter taiwanensis TaxID=1748242 RepID=UPI00203636BA|nr:hypothetical protein [Spongiibacter taiwanensis]USA42605.1 hypothetical protein NCG89_13810 [Spongiibacter taiwanensis]